MALEDYSPIVQQVINTGTKISLILDEFDDLTDAANVLSVCISNLLLCRARTEQEAHDLMSQIENNVDKTVLLTKEYGVTSWAEGTPH